MPILARATATLSILLLALFVAGCGGSDDSNADDDSGAARDASSATASADAGGEDPRPSVKQYVTAIESCAVMNLDASYDGCLDQARLLEEEPALADVPGETTVRPAEDPKQSFQVMTSLDGATFTETHSADGRITKTCEPADAPRCTDGTW